MESLNVEMQASTTDGVKLIVHATCTGWGNTDLEPNVHDYKWQLAQLKKLIGAGFPTNHCVLRIDPIFPTNNGLKRVIEVLQEFEHFIQVLPVYASAFMTNINTLKSASNQKVISLAMAIVSMRPISKYCLLATH